MGFERPSWEAVAAGVRPPLRDPEDFEPGTVRQVGSAKPALARNSTSEMSSSRRFLSKCKRWSDPKLALARGRQNPQSPPTVRPQSRTTCFAWFSFAVSVSLSPSLPIWPWPSSCSLRIGGGAWSSGFCVGKCSGEDLPRRWRKSEDEHVFAGMDLGVPVGDSRRLEVVVDGLPLRGGAQLAVDTTLVCALHEDGRPRRRAAEFDGVALQAAERKKFTTYRELVGPCSRAKLVLLAVEVGGRWSEQTTRVFS